MAVIGSLVLCSCFGRMGGKLFEEGIGTDRGRNARSMEERDLMVTRDQRCMVWTLCHSRIHNEGRTTSSVLPYSLERCQRFDIILRVSKTLTYESEHGIKRSKLLWDACNDPKGLDPLSMSSTPN